MDTFLKINSTNTSSQCNLIDPFFFNDLKGGVNPETGREFTEKELSNVKSTLYRMSNTRGGKLGVCCDPSDSYDNIDQTYFNNFKKTYPKIKLLKRSGELEGILLSKTKNISGDEWIEPTPYHVCKLSKSTIIDSKYPNVKIATRLVKNCFTDSCDNTEMINFNQVIGKSITEEQGYTAFDDARVSQAIREGNITFLKKFIRKYKRINGNLTNNDYGNRLLHIAAEVNQPKIMELLLALKPDINIVNTLNQTPLHYAVKYNNYDNAESLIKLGAEMKVRDLEGNTPIFYAIENGNIGMIRLLYNNGSGLINKNKNLDNALHHCVKKCPDNKDTIAIYRFLLERGVPVEQINNDGKTPLELIKDKLDLYHKKEKFNVTNVESNELEPSHQKLLEIQTILFNNIIRNNPNKYNDYINVSEVPKGAPIEVLDTLCVGPGNISGNETSQECVNKGGKIIKIDKPSTKIKIELLPESEKLLDTVRQEDLYLIKDPDSSNNPKTNDNIKKYNEKLGSLSNLDNSDSKQELINNENLVRNQEIDNSEINIHLNNEDINSEETTINNNDEHPHIQSEDSYDSKKERKKAFQNKHKINKENKSKKDNQNDSFGKSFMKMIKKHKYTTLIVSLILLIIVIYIIMKYVMPKLNKPKPTIIRTI